jgi:signal transduction histidine kinase
LLILMALLQLVFGRRDELLPLWMLDVSLVLLAAILVLSLYLPRTPAITLNAVLIVLLTYLFRMHPFFAVLLGSSAAIVSFFLLRVRQENELLLHEQRQKERELQLAMRELEKLGERKDEMLFTASHDLRTPVGIIRSSLATIRDGYAGKVNKEASQYIDAAFRAAERLRAMLEDILEASVVENKDEVVLRPVQLEEVVGSVVESHAKACKHVRLVYPKPPYTTPKVWADGRMLQRAIDNLLLNAIKFTPKGSITIATEQHGARVRCTVADTGIGISEADQEQLFSKFYRASNTQNSDMRGSGLGLYITKQIIQRLRGTIRFSSELNKGTVFTIELPAVTA